MTEDRQALVDPARLRDRTVEFIRIPSLGGEEEAAITRMAEWLSDIPGAEVEVWHDDQATLQQLDGYPGHEIARASVPVVAARLRGARPGPAILLTGHIDVVPPGDPSTWSHDPYSGLIEGDRLYGRGSCDMKSGVIAGLEVLEAFAAGGHDFPGQIIFVAVPGEEDGGVGTFSAIKRGWSADAAIIPEPTSDEGRPRLVVAHAGCIILEIHVAGRAAHASTRRMGESALDHYLVLHEAMRADESRINDAEDDPMMRMHDLPYATNVGIIQGGAFASSVMDSLTVHVRIGVPLGETVAETEQRFRRIISEAAATDPWLRDNPPVVNIVTRSFGSARIPVEHPLVHAVSDAAEELLGHRPVPRAAPYGCDMAGWVRLANVPTILYGPGDIQIAHGADEWVSVSQTVDVARVLTSATDRLLRADLPNGHGGHTVVPSELPPPPD